MGTSQTSSLHRVGKSRHLAPIVLREIKAEMARQARSQAWLARELDLTQAAISRRFRGEVSLSLDELDSIADVLGCASVDFVLAPERHSDQVAS